MSRNHVALRGDWRSSAACTRPGVDFGIFFAPPRGRVPRTWDRRAKAVCASCPVVSECLTVALDNREATGVWGGRTPKERRSLLKRRKDNGRGL
ncbi:WhiB family transcriptional regulator [Streptomyces chartreusis]|uniref:WhiB family transcriptional regulator n=1 Tax=Streptomyces chartreusis TaxID=1969 RepID=UPI0037FB6228